MQNVTWGILGTENVPSARRTRTLGLGAAVRLFNELAVPGMGGAWFGKQLFLALAGIAVNEQVTRSRRSSSNIQVADAIEALGCWLQYRRTDSARDARLRGIDKLDGITAAPFSTFGQKGFYVTQPMRMGTVQALRTLDLVDTDGERFNGYICSKTGHAFLDTVWSDLRPRNLPPLEALTRWVEGALDPVTEKMRQLLSPVEPLPDAARGQLRELLVTGDSEEAARRRAVLRWMDSMRSVDGRLLPPEDTPAPSISARHQHDLTAGTMFFEMQAAAMAVLDAVEVELAGRAGHALPLREALTEHVAAAVQALRTSARRFQSHGFDHPEADVGISFARDCADAADLTVLERLVPRDERVLRLRDGVVVPGMAFDCNATLDRSQDRNDDEDETPPSGRLPFPQYMSYRVRNAWLFNLDLHGQLDQWLDGEKQE